MAACGGGGGGGGGGILGSTDPVPKSSTYTWTNNSNSFVLTITETPAHALITSGSYVLQITSSGTTYSSKGTASSSGSSVTLTPSVAGDTAFTLTVSETKVTVAAGTIVCGGHSITLTAGDSTLTTPPDAISFTHDFTTAFAQLGLSAGTGIIAAMDARYAAAQTVNGAYAFYPNQAATPETVSGVSFKRALIYGAEPRVGFSLDTSSLRMYGDGNGLDESITFDVAVIRTTDGKGWLTTNQTRTFKALAEGTPITLSTLTNGTITNVSGLSGYKVYVIVKTTKSLTSFPNLNDHADFKLENVITVYP